LIQTEEYRKYAFFALLVFLLWIFYLMISPYLTFAILGVILGIGAYPLYLRVKQKIKKEMMSALITVILIILIIIIPTIIISSALVRETFVLISSLNSEQFSAQVVEISSILGSDVDISPQINSFLSNISSNAFDSTWNLIGSVTDTAIGLLLMFTIIFYCFTDGPTWVSRLSSFAPFDSRRKTVLVEKIKSVTKTVIQVEILISIIQGILGGISFYIADVPNPIFWGFIMALFSFLPFVGTGMIWGPAAIIKIITGEIGWGIFLLIYGFMIIGGVDYYLRPKLVSGSSRIHPLTALLGAFGGLKLLGFPGLIIGPLIAALLEAVIIFHYEDATKSFKKRK
jgi:predicted PurR-regulated permease PerM